jgi:hypothetical protein
MAKVGRLLVENFPIQNAPTWEKEIDYRSV